MSNALELAMDTLDSDASSDRKEKARATIREMVTPIQGITHANLHIRGKKPRCYKCLGELDPDGLCHYCTSALPQTHETHETEKD